MKNQEYQIVLADPPWHYNSRKYPGTRFGMGVHGHYQTMLVDRISALPVSNIAADDAVLFLWATWPRLPAAIQVISAWGFEYKTIGFLWVKLNPGRKTLPRRDLAQQIYANGCTAFCDWLTFFGVGYYAKSNTEPCLLATRGDTLPTLRNDLSSVVFAARGGHSAKPVDVRERIVAMFGDRKRVELFAREEPAGWDVWGNEVESTALLGATDD